MPLLSSIPGILVMILGFGVLIFVHELGHFLAAKWAGIRTESFAVGMGPVLASWRRGVGVALGSTNDKVVARAGRPAIELSDEELAQHGLGETEYSLRWLPIGGFVKMLGQDDLNPDAATTSARSYTVCPVGKRMIVVSAGVVMNVLLAMVLFAWAFMVGVEFGAPVIGSVRPSGPAARAVAQNATALGITTPGLLPADHVTHIDGDPIRTYSDIAIAAAMGRPTAAIDLTVERAGYAEPLQFSIRPEIDPGTGLLSLGAAPGASNRLVGGDGEADAVQALLDEIALGEQGVESGMTLESAAGEAVLTREQFERIVADRGGESIATTWRRTDETGAPAGPEIHAEVAVHPQFQVLRNADPADGGIRDIEYGLFGLVPLTKVLEVTAGQNEDLLRRGDAFLVVGAQRGPTLGALTGELQAHANDEITVTVLRDGEEVTFTARIDRKGHLGFRPGYAWELPLLAAPLHRVLVGGGASPAGSEPIVEVTPAAALGLDGVTEVTAVNGVPVMNWSDLRAQFRASTDRGGESAGAAAVTLTLAGDEPRDVTMEIPASDVETLHALAWRSAIPEVVFEPLMTSLDAGGNPLQAVVMGVTETQKMITMTYLTIDRLIRRTVGVEQLRGPVGIIDLGAKILPRGFMFFLFFLGMISVNLAVLNFLPLPIVDGGLFLFLIYEKIKGTPPSIAFQNAATVVGLFLIGTVFVVTFYNDIMRLL